MPIIDKTTPVGVSHHNFGLDLGSIGSSQNNNGVGKASDVSEVKVNRIARIAFDFLEKVYSCITDVLAFVLYPLARRCVMFTSSATLKKQCSNEQFKRSTQALKDFGGKEAIIKSQGNQLHAMHFNFDDCLKQLIKKGGILESIVMPDGHKQNTLVLPNKELVDLIDKMGIPKYSEKNKTFIHIGEPDSQLNAQNATVIYAPGSGHVFEFRRPTIGAFVMGFGMNMVSAHYTGTGKSPGKLTEASTYADMESIYNYLTKEVGVANDKILPYGHCAGAGPLLHLAEKYNLNTFLDGTFTRMGDFARLRFHKFLIIPDLLWRISAWVTPTMNKCFQYPNVERVQNLKKAIVITFRTHDELIPKSYIDELLDASKATQDKTLIEMNLNHDENFGADLKAKSEVGAFLKKQGLIG